MLMMASDIFSLSLSTDALGRWSCTMQSTCTPPPPLDIARVRSLALHHFLISPFAHWTMRVVLDFTCMACHPSAPQIPAKQFPRTLSSAPATLGSALSLSRSANQHMPFYPSGFIGHISSAGHGMYIHTWRRIMLSVTAKPFHSIYFPCSCGCSGIANFKVRMLHGWRG